MAEPQLPDPVKLFVAALWADDTALAEAVRLLEERWGACDFTGPDHPFDRTDYYAGEMGPELQRRLLAFAQLVPPESLVEAKLFCNEIEDRLRGTGGRRVNLDVGYLDHNKIVLASAKPAGQKIHLGRGIHADLVGRYAHGRYEPFPWTFPDFRDGRYDPELGELRRRYLEQLRELRAGDAETHRE
jgi:hypothetical protein